VEEVVVEMRVRASCKRFAIKDNGICAWLWPRQRRASQFFSPENNAGGDKRKRLLKKWFLLDCRQTWSNPKVRVGRRPIRSLLGKNSADRNANRTALTERLNNPQFTQDDQDDRVLIAIPCW